RLGGFFCLLDFTIDLHKQVFCPAQMAPALELLTDQRQRHGVGSATRTVHHECPRIVHGSPARRMPHSHHGLFVKLPRLLANNKENRGVARWMKRPDRLLRRWFSSSISSPKPEEILHVPSSQEERQQPLQRDDDQRQERPFLPENQPRPWRWLFAGQL